MAYDTTNIVKDTELRNTTEARYWQGPTRNCYDRVAFEEVLKQTMYSREMGIVSEYGDEYGDFDLRTKSVIDIGAGPWSMLLRSYNAKWRIAVDPIDWPPSVRRRYAAYNIEFIQKGGEDIGDLPVADEVWLYNCLQHVTDPMLVLENAKKIGRKIRIFEWLHIPTDICHPHLLTPEMLFKGLKGTTTEQANVKRMTEYQNNADAFIGVFSTLGPQSKDLIAIPKD